MCGIAGLFLKEGENTQSYEPLIKGVQERLRNRGPDRQDYWIKDNIGFIHTRLSIQDLSEAGNQPMHLEKDGLSICYNGEVYNFKEIRTELEKLGHHFNSHSDTEVILKSYLQWGKDCIQRFNGMFAFAIFNHDERELFIARDRLGIKPLYFIENESGFFFASNIKALLGFKQSQKEIDPESLHFYMSLHSIVPGASTIFKDIKKLPPGCTLTKRAGETSQQINYWQADYRHQDQLSEDEWFERTEAALLKAVERRMIADVPVGLFLSGGVDSSLILALMNKALGSSEKIQTFSVGFANAKDEDGDEFKYSDIVSSHYKTKHHRFFVETSEILENLDQCLSNMNEPMVSYDNIGFYLLSQKASKEVKVVQSGQGADEIFAGYHWYQDIESSKTPVDDYSKLFFDRSESEMKKALSPEFYHPNTSYSFVETYFSEQKISSVDQALRIDTNVMLVEDPVKRVDSNTMAFGLEARVPFLDHELVELCARMPYSMKLPDGGKYLLKKIARKYIPSEVIDRPKGYFPVPQLKYIQGPFLEYVKNYISKESVESRGLFNWNYVKPLLENPTEHITPLRGSKLWQIATLEIWLNQVDQ